MDDQILQNPWRAVPFPPTVGAELIQRKKMGDSPDGIEVASVMLAERPGLAVLVMSGFSDSEPKALEKGFAFVPKPFTGTCLRQRVREVLVSKRPPESETRANLRTGDKFRAAG